MKPNQPSNLRRDSVWSSLPDSPKRAFGSAIRLTDDGWSKIITPALITIEPKRIRPEFLRGGE